MIYSKTNKINGCFEKYAVVEVKMKALTEKEVGCSSLWRGWNNANAVNNYSYAFPYITINTGKRKSNVLSICQMGFNIVDGHTEIHNEDFFISHRNSRIIFDGQLEPTSENGKEYKVQLIVPLYPCPLGSKAMGNYIKSCQSFWYNLGKRGRLANKPYVSLAVDCNGKLFSTRLTRRRLIYYQSPIDCEVLSTWEWEKK